MPIRGEYWIQNGYVNFADGDVTGESLNFKSWFENHETNLEEKILNGINDDSVSQNTFNQYLNQYVKTHNPALSDKKMDYRRSFDHSVYLSGQNSTSLQNISQKRKTNTGHSNIGLLVTPKTYFYLRSKNLKHYSVIGIDNGMFTDAGKNLFTWDKYKKLVKFAMAQVQTEVIDSLQFFAIPDVPFNWNETLKLYQNNKESVEELRSLGAPAAMVVQNGATVHDVPWDGIDAIFIGGDDKWKEGKDVEINGIQFKGQDLKDIVQEAKKRGLPVHMGRVNNLNRLNVANSLKVDTVDGTTLMFRLAKALYNIVLNNPKRPQENNVLYRIRIKKIFDGQHQESDLNHPHKAVTEKDVTAHLTDKIVDAQIKNAFNRRYNAIASLIQQLGNRKLSREALHQYERFLPDLPSGIHDDPDIDVVEFDAEGNVKTNSENKPVINQQLKNVVSANSSDLLHTLTDIPMDELKSFIGYWRNAGVLPH